MDNTCNHDPINIQNLSPFKLLTEEFLFCVHLNSRSYRQFHTDTVIGTYCPPPAGASFIVSIFLRDPVLRPPWWGREKKLHCILLVLASFALHLFFLPSYFPETLAW